jgi:hypothetical protein
MNNMLKAKKLAAQGARGQWSSFGHKGAVVWLALVAMACLTMWRWVESPANNSFEQAQQRAAEAVEMELGGVANLSALSASMTKEAAKRALADRTASGLEDALLKSGSKIKATATPVTVERTATGWNVKGVALAQWEGKGPAVTGPWHGEWTAALILEKSGELKVSKLSVSSREQEEGSIP